MRVLIVDDDMRLAESVGWALDARGYEVYFATTSQMALELMDEYMPEAVITDWDLKQSMESEENGDWLTREIKKLWPTTGVLLWSGLTRPPVAEADSQIVKTDIDEMLAFVEYEKEVREG